MLVAPPRSRVRCPGCRRVVLVVIGARPEAIKLLARQLTGGGSWAKTAREPLEPEPEIEAELP